MREEGIGRKRMEEKERGVSRRRKEQSKESMKEEWQHSIEKHLISYMWLEME